LREVIECLAAIAALQAEPTRKREQRWVGGGLAQRRLQRLERGLRCLQLASHCGEELLGPYVVRVAGHDPREVHFGLAEVALLHVHQPKQNPGLGVVRIGAHSFFEKGAGSRRVAGGRQRLAAHHLRERVLRGRLQQRFGSRNRLLLLALPQLRFSQSRQRRETVARFIVIGSELDSLGQGRLRRREITAPDLRRPERKPVTGLVLHGLRRALEDPACRDGAVNGEGGRREALNRRKAVRMDPQCCLKLRPRFGNPAQPEQRVTARNGKVAVDGGIADVVTVLQDLLVRAADGQQAALRHHDVLALGAEVACLGQLDLGTSEIADLEHRQGELRPRPGVLRMLGDVVAQVDHRRAVLASVEARLGALEQLLAAWAAGREQRQHGQGQDAVGLGHGFSPRRHARASGCRSWRAGRRASGA
jgi:hypothetical protein